MNRFHLTRPGLTATGLVLMLNLLGCASLGEGITSREFDAGLKNLTPGMTQSEVLTTLGEPREKRPAPASADHTSTWIYSRLETIGHTTVIDEGAVGRGGAGLPTYREEPDRVIMEYHLEWDGDVLVRSTQKPL